MTRCVFDGLARRARLRELHPGSTNGHCRGAEHAKTNVSRAVKNLIEFEIILEGPKIGRSKTYRLKPQFGWKGTVSNHKKALKNGLSVIQGGEFNAPFPACVLAVFLRLIPELVIFFDAVCGGTQKHILSGTQISFGIPSGFPEISTLHVHTYTRITSGKVRQDM